MREKLVTAFGVVLLATVFITVNTYNPANDPNSFYCQLMCIDNFTYCSSVPPDGCNENQRLVKKGSPCRCCDICVTLMDEGEECHGNWNNALYRQCKPGLKCNSGMCLNFTSIADLIKDRRKPFQNWIQKVSKKLFDKVFG
ncbi:hypothetical protein C0J52_18727 [Blattella germanica]|nr:hypothetical protein C0J52_18727 [Blattella germanica]